MHLQPVLCPEINCPILPSRSPGSFVEVSEASALKKTNIDEFSGPCLQSGVLLLAESNISDTQVQKWCGKDQGGLERACVLEWALFYTVHQHELSIFRSLLAGKIRLWGSRRDQVLIPIPCDCADLA